MDTVRKKYLDLTNKFETLHSVEELDAYAPQLVYLFNQADELEPCRDARAIQSNVCWLCGTYAVFFMEHWKPDRIPKTEYMRFYLNNFIKIVGLASAGLHSY